MEIYLVWLIGPIFLNQFLFWYVVHLCASIHSTSFLSVLHCCAFLLSLTRVSNRNSISNLLPPPKMYNWGNTTSGWKTKHKCLHKPLLTAKPLKFWKHQNVLKFLTCELYHTMDMIMLNLISMELPLLGNNLLLLLELGNNLESILLSLLPFYYIIIIIIIIMCQVCCRHRRSWPFNPLCRKFSWWDHCSEILFLLRK